VSPVSLSGKIIGAEEAKLFPVPIADAGRADPKESRGILKDIAVLLYSIFIVFLGRGTTRKSESEKTEAL
jgi:hypothetical protein